jgi:phosphate transport system protein
MWNQGSASATSEISHTGPHRELPLELRRGRLLPLEEHTLSVIDRALNGLHRKVVTMGRIACDQVNWVTRALLDGDLQAHAYANSRATSLHELNRRIEQETFTLIALYQPVATDLWLVRRLLRIARDLGNLAAEVETMARLAPQLSGARAPGAHRTMTRHLERMVRVADAMLRHSVQALDGSDTDLVRKVIERQDDIHSEFESAAGSLLAFSLQVDGHRRAAVDALFALNGLERIAEYARRIGIEVLAVLNH